MDRIFTWTQGFSFWPLLVSLLLVHSTILSFPSHSPAPSILVCRPPTPHVLSGSILGTGYFLCLEHAPQQTASSHFIWVSSTSHQNSYQAPFSSETPPPTHPPPQPNNCYVFPQLLRTYSFGRIHPVGVESIFISRLLILSGHGLFSYTSHISVPSTVPDMCSYLINFG